jgi:multiple sugar transport system ATP-binding protein
VGDGIDIPLPERYKGSIKGFTGDKLAVGVRPEHLDVNTEGPAGTLSGTADVVEYLGNEELIHLTVGEHDIVSLIGSEHRVRPGDALSLKIPLEKVHLFDPESSVALDKQRDTTDARRGGAARKAEPTPASV